MMSKMCDLGVDVVFPQLDSFIFDKLPDPIILGGLLRTNTRSIFHECIIETVDKLGIVEPPPYFVAGHLIHGSKRMVSFAGLYRLFCYLFDI